MGIQDYHIRLGYHHIRRYRVGSRFLQRDRFFCPGERQRIQCKQICGNQPEPGKPFRRNREYRYHGAVSEQQQRTDNGGKRHGLLPVSRQYDHVDGSFRHDQSVRLSDRDPVNYIYDIHLQYRDIVIQPQCNLNRHPDFGRKSFSRDQCGI